MGFIRNQRDRRDGRRYGSVAFTDFAVLCPSHVPISIAQLSQSATCPSLLAAGLGDCLTLLEQSVRRGPAQPSICDAPWRHARSPPADVRPSTRSQDAAQASGSRRQDCRRTRPVRHRRGRVRRTASSRRGRTDTSAYPPREDERPFGDPGILALKRTSSVRHRQTRMESAGRHA